MCYRTNYKDNYVTDLQFKALKELDYKYVAYKSSYKELTNNTLLKILSIYPNIYALCTDTINNIYLIEITNLKEA